MKSSVGGIYHVVIPYPDCPTCLLASGLFDSFTAYSSHEFAEAVTDPALSAWYETIGGHEIGGACGARTARSGGYLLQTVWSNARAACVLNPPMPRT